MIMEQIIHGSSEEIFALAFAGQGQRTDTLKMKADEQISSETYRSAEAPLIELESVPTADLFKELQLREEAIVFGAGSDMPYEIRPKDGVPPLPVGQEPLYVIAIRTHVLPKFRPWQEGLCFLSLYHRSDKIWQLQYCWSNGTELYSVRS